MELPNYDLHCHSTASDGSLTPVELVERAIGNGIEVLALTDHDTLSGVAKLQNEESLGLKLISGTELTAQWNRRVIHVVGLGVDFQSEALITYLDNLAKLRQERSVRIAEQLIKMGLPDLLEEAKGIAGEGIIGRPHFAKAMIAQGVVSTEQQAFKQYLGTGKKGDIKIEWPSLERVIEVISQAGGIAVLAHPTKYKMTFTKLRAVIKSFVEAGGKAIEVSYPGMTPDHHYHLLRIANENNLMLSAGSDFHTPSQGWTDLGKFPPLKSKDNHVLAALL